MTRYPRGVTLLGRGRARGKNQAGDRYPSAIYRRVRPTDGRPWHHREAQGSHLATSDRRGRTASDTGRPRRKDFDGQETAIDSAKSQEKELDSHPLDQFLL